MNDYFQFKQFTVHQDGCAMKVGTDGVLLGAWANVEDALEILDIGTGTGLIAIMCAQRSHALIDAVEIDSKAAEQAEENRLLCPWKERITIFNDSFQHYVQSNRPKYDRIVTNPPYFRDSLKSPDKGRSLARHDDKLSYEVLFHYSALIIEPRGLISMIMPYRDNELTDRIAFFNGFYPARKSFVRPYEGKEFSRCLAEYAPYPSSTCFTDELIIKKAGNEYTGSFRELTNDFYLNF